MEVLKTRILLVSKGYHSLSVVLHAHYNYVFHAETETNLPVDTNSPTRRKFDILSMQHHSILQPNFLYNTSKGNDDHLPLTPNDEELKLEMEKIQPVVCGE